MINGPGGSHFWLMVMAILKRDILFCTRPTLSDLRTGTDF